jgi:hypothetical protein
MRIVNLVRYGIEQYVGPERVCLGETEQALHKDGRTCEHRSQVPPFG